MSSSRMRVSLLSAHTPRGHSGAGNGAGGPSGSPPPAIAPLSRPPAGAAPLQLPTMPGSKGSASATASPRAVAGSAATSSQQQRRGVPKRLKVVDAFLETALHSPSTQSDTGPGGGGNHESPPGEIALPPQQVPGEAPHHGPPRYSGEGGEWAAHGPIHRHPLAAHPGGTSAGQPSGESSFILDAEQEGLGEIGEASAAAQAAASSEGEGAGGEDGGNRGGGAAVEASEEAAVEAEAFGDATAEEDEELADFRATGQGLVSDDFAHPASQAGTSRRRRARVHKRRGSTGGGEVRSRVPQLPAYLLPPEPTLEVPEEGEGGSVGEAAAGGGGPVHPAVAAGATYGYAPGWYAHAAQGPPIIYSPVHGESRRRRQRRGRRKVAAKPAAAVGRAGTEPGVVAAAPDAAAPEAERFMSLREALEAEVAGPAVQRGGGEGGAEQEEEEEGASGFESDTEGEEEEGGGEEEGESESEDEESESEVEIFLQQGGRLVGQPMATTREQHGHGPRRTLPGRPGGRRAKRGVAAPATAATGSPLYMEASPFHASMGQQRPDVAAWEARAAAGGGGDVAGGLLPQEAFAPSAERPLRADVDAPGSSVATATQPSAPAPSPPLPLTPAPLHEERPPSPDLETLSDSELLEAGRSRHHHGHSYHHHPRASRRERGASSAGEAATPSDSGDGSSGGPAPEPSEAVAAAATAVVPIPEGSGTATTDASSSSRLVFGPPEPPPPPPTPHAAGVSSASSGVGLHEGAGFDPSAIPEDALAYPTIGASPDMYTQKKRFGIIFCEDDPAFVQELPARWVQLLREGKKNEDWLLYRTAETGRLPSPDDDLDGVLIPGSHHNVRDNLPWMHDLSRFIRANYIPYAADASLPEHRDKVQIVGSCFGAQIIAAACGGCVAHNPRGQYIIAAEEIYPTEAFVRQPFARGLILKSKRGIGFQPRSDRWRHPTDDAGVLPYMRITETHGDSVITLPADSQVLGTSRSIANEIFLCGKSLLGYQSHPEFSWKKQILPQIIPYVFGDASRMRKEDLEEARRSFALPLHSYALIEVTRRFLKKEYRESLAQYQPAENTVFVKRGR